MIKLGLLLTNHYRLLSVAAILDVFETVNRIYFEQGKELPFEINVLCNAEQQQAVQSADFSGYAVTRLTKASRQDLILIPSFKNENVSEAVCDNNEVILWLQQQYRDGTGIASFCTGTFLLAATGLLNGKCATTHVDASKAFELAFPKVKLESERTVTQDGILYTSGGATSSFHLMLYLIRQYCGKEIAVRIAKRFSIDMDRSCQSYFRTFSISRNHSDDLVAMAQEKIESAYHNTGTIEEMIKDIPASRRNIVRRFKLVTGITPIQYLQQTRVEAAKKMLEMTGEQMTEVIYKSGYHDPKAFRKIFRKTVGMTPSEYREKFYVG